MLTALYSVGSVAGADLWMKVVLLTSLAYFLICFSFRRSRSGRGVLTVLMGWLLTELLCDMVWLAWFWPGGAYRNGPQKRNRASKRCHGKRQRNWRSDT